MRKLFATFFIGFFLTLHALSAYELELNGSYDYFRNSPDGSWNGNPGAFIAANAAASIFDTIAFQLGGSYGLYNWDGHKNLVFKNSKSLEHQAFITVGASTRFCQFNAGLVYDRLFTNHFGIYDLDPSIDQLRFQAGYQFCFDEIGFWGTIDLNRAHEHALGVPISFKAIGQINLFWSHFFQNYAKATAWIGLPYRHSLISHHRRPGNFIAGFALRAPLTNSLYVDGFGSYMRARTQHGSIQSRNYSANICLGLTYLFGADCLCYDITYLPLANHSNFLVDTNINQ